MTGFLELEELLTPAYVVTLRQQQLASVQVPSGNTSGEVTPTSVHQSNNSLGSRTLETIGESVLESNEKNDE